MTDVTFHRLLTSGLLFPLDVITYFLHFLFIFSVLSPFNFTGCEINNSHHNVIVYTVEKVTELGASATASVVA